MYDVIKANFFHYADQYSCTLNALDKHMQAECSCNSIAVMFQMIVQASNHSKVYSNQSMNPHTPVTVEVERDGLYLVTIFLIREGRGILDSEIYYMEQVLVMDYNLPTSGTAPTITSLASSTRGTVAMLLASYTHVIVCISPIVEFSLFKLVNFHD